MVYEHPSVEKCVHFFILDWGSDTDNLPDLQVISFTYRAVVLK